MNPEAFAFRCALGNPRAPTDLSCVSGRSRPNVQTQKPGFFQPRFHLEVTQKGDEIYFNLGIDKQRKKTAIS
jgi:hypothetical protein